MEAQLETDPHPDYIKGFNEGYVLAKEQPDLAAKIAKALGDTERGKGFQGGQWQCKEEMDKDR